MIAKGGKRHHQGTDIGVYSDLDTTISEPDPSLERYMLALHDMKATFDKAMESDASINLAFNAGF